MAISHSLIVYKRTHQNTRELSQRMQENPAKHSLKNPGKLALTHSLHEYKRTLQNILYRNTGELTKTYSFQECRKALQNILYKNTEESLKHILSRNTG